MSLELNLALSGGFAKISSVAGRATSQTRTSEVKHGKHEDTLDEQFVERVARLLESQRWLRQLLREEAAGMLE